MSRNSQRMADLLERKKEISRRHDAIMSKVKLSSTHIGARDEHQGDEDDARQRLNRRSERMMERTVSGSDDLLSRRSLGQRKVDSSSSEDFLAPIRRRTRRNTVKISTHDQLLEELGKLFTAIQTSSKGVVSEEPNLSVFAALARFQGNSLENKSVEGPKTPAMSRLLVRQAVQKIEEGRRESASPGLLKNEVRVADQVVNHYPRSSLRK